MRKRAKRSKPSERKQEILRVAINLASGIGHNNITRDLVAQHCDITSSLIAKYYSTMLDLKRAVFKEAIRLEILPILAHCLSFSTCRMTPELKSKVLQYLSK